MPDRGIRIDGAYSDIEAGDSAIKDEANAQKSLMEGRILDGQLPQPTLTGMQHETAWVR
jgi:hypothetical protein